MTDHKPLPVHGYTPQSQSSIALVNENKLIEERLLRRVEDTVLTGLADPRWIAVARTHFQEGFMAFNRAIMQPQRVSLPEDAAPPPQEQARMPILDQKPETD